MHYSVIPAAMCQLKTPFVIISIIGKSYDIERQLKIQNQGRVYYRKNMT